MTMLVNLSQNDIIKTNVCLTGTLWSLGTDPCEWNKLVFRQCSIPRCSWQSCQWSLRFVSFNMDCDSWKSRMVRFPHQFVWQQNGDLVQPCLKTCGLPDVFEAILSQILAFGADDTNCHHCRFDSDQPLSPNRKWKFGQFQSLAEHGLDVLPPLACLLWRRSNNQFHHCCQYTFHKFVRRTFAIPNLAAVPRKRLWNYDSGRIIPIHSICAKLRLCLLKTLADGPNPNPVYAKYWKKLNEDPDKYMQPNLAATLECFKETGRYIARPYTTISEIVII